MPFTTTFLRHPRRIGAVAALALLGAIACSSPTEDARSAFRGNTGGSGGSGGNGGSGGTSGQGGGILGGFGGEAGTGGGVDDAGACAATSNKGELTPLDIFIMLDYSGSMQGQKWTAATNGLTAFVNDPKAAGIGVGLQYFAIEAPGPFGIPDDSCNPNDYATAAVPIAELPGNAAALSSSIAQHNKPNTGTPTAPALVGALMYAQAWETQHPDHQTVVLLVTDGDPSGCPNQDPQTIASYAAAASAGQGGPAINTYVVGMPGATKSNLDLWAAAGGTQTSYDATDTATFLSALDKIRGTALACEYAIPVPEAGTVDLDLVNVNWSANGQTTELLEVADAAGCDPATGGWYYDVKPPASKHIEICPASCDAIKAANTTAGSNAEVDILLGCKSKGVQ